MKRWALVGHILELAPVEKRDFLIRQDFTAGPNFLAKVSSQVLV